MATCRCCFVYSFFILILGRYYYFIFIFHGDEIFQKNKFHETLRP